MTTGMDKWYIERDVPAAHIGYRAIIDQDGYLVCEPSPMGEHKAHLIKAAPQMLAALQAFQEAMTGGDEGVDPDALDSALEAATAAIAIATGAREA